MKPNERDLLAVAAAQFHQDFDVDDWSAQDVFAAVARGLPKAHRAALFDGLEAMLKANLVDEDYFKSWSALGADWPPERSDVEQFLAWSRSEAGKREIESKGPIALHVVVQANLNPPGD